MSVVDRFLNYVKIDTQSTEHSDSIPSTLKQLDLAHLLVRELQEMGVKEVDLDANGYIIAHLPSNLDKQVPAIGFVAHMDTSPEISGKDVKPQILENYDGEDIVLDKSKNVILSPSDFSELKLYIGQTLITTDGTTLLGADDKAGVAEIMTAVEYLMKHPEFPHGRICIGFTPDEETGHGVDLFDVKKFGADLAYTVDGGRLGELEYENFNAAGAAVFIQGRNVHPGSAKNKMINAILIAAEFNGLLPENERPGYTEGYEGFYHLLEFNGAVEEAKLSYIIRDHDREKFEAKKALFNAAIQFINAKYGEGTIRADVQDQYYNMKEKILPVMDVIEVADQAMREAGVTPIVQPIRGGTDGAKLSYMGLPTPNIFSGGHNFHGKYEYIPVESMEKAVEVVLNIIRLYSEK